MRNSQVIPPKSNTGEESPVDIEDLKVEEKKAEEKQVEVLEVEDMEVDELKGPNIPQNPKKAYLLALLDSIVFGFGNHYAAALARRKNGALGLFCQWPTLFLTSACFHLYKYIQ